MAKELKVAIGIAVVALLVLIGAIFAIAYKSGDNKQPEAKPAYSYSAEQDAKFDDAWNKVGGSMSAERARDYAKQVCTRLRQGDSVESVANDIFDIAGTTDTGYILGGSAYVYCTEQSSRIENGIDDLANGRT